MKKAKGILRALCSPPLPPFFDLETTHFDFIVVPNGLKILDIGGENLDIDRNEQIKLNEVDAVGIIERSNYSDSIKSTLLEIHNLFFNVAFGRGDIVRHKKLVSFRHELHQLPFSVKCH